ncbi:MAG: endonuclease/exonuclease/phosphatase family protein [Elusimicrobiota bacterium]
MRVLTFNCCALPVLTGDIPARLRRLGRELVVLAPDLILLQEVFLARHLRLLKQALSSWPYSFFGPRTLRRHAGGLAIFSRYPLTGAKFFLYREQGSWIRYSALAKFSGKGYMAARLHHPSGADFKLVHTHMLADYRRPTKTGAGRRDPYQVFQHGQIEELRAFIGGMDRSEPVLLAGDFNLTPASDMMRRFLQRTGLGDSMAGVRTPSIIGRKYYRVPFNRAPEKRLDYILHRGGGSWRVRARKWRYVFARPRKLADSRRVTLSDHRGVHIDLEVRHAGC